MADTINREMAEQEFERWADLMAIEIEKDNMGADDVDSFNEQKGRIVKSICRGNLVIDDAGLAVYTPFRSDDKTPLTFYEPTGAVMVAMDKRGKGQDFAKMFETMGAMTKTHATKFSKMAMADLKVCQAVAVLFLA